MENRLRLLRGLLPKRGKKLCFFREIKNVVLEELILDQLKRVMSLAKDREDEFAESTERAKKLEGILAEKREKNFNAESFLKLVRSCTDIQRLDCEVVRTFIQKVLVHKKEVIDGKKVQKIDIFFNGIGKLSLPGNQ